MEFRFAESGLVRSFFKDILTGKDGESYDAGRAMGLLGGCIYLGLGCYRAMLAEQAFDFLSFGGGFAALATGIGALLKLKEGTEPAPTPASTNVETR